MVSLEDGKADTVVAAMKDIIHKNELPTNRLYGLGTDGAAVMTGDEFITNPQYFAFMRKYCCIFFHTSFLS